ncbi:MAG: DUF2617 family protein [Phycisphaeraceae bacterium]|nr:MAG: DUF2617 family protein [Phycisphaeraceae bacterium]
MNTPVRVNSLQTFQVVFYDRVLHPELFALKGRRVVKQSGYEFEAWLMPGSHVLRFEMGEVRASELVAEQDRSLPMKGVVHAFVCAGEHEWEHTFAKQGVTYMTTVQSETLAENVYESIYREMSEHAREMGSLCHAWEDEAGRCLSLIDIERRSKDVSAECYHLIASSGLVLRTQTIFERS